MLKQLQWRFIRIAMGSMLAVLLFLLTGINLLYYWNFRSGAAIFQGYYTKQSARAH